MPADCAHGSPLPGPRLVWPVTLSACSCVSALRQISCLSASCFVNRWGEVTSSWACETWLPRRVRKTVPVMKTWL